MEVEVSVDGKQHERRGKCGLSGADEVGGGWGR